MFKRVVEVTKKELITGTETERIKTNLSIKNIGRTRNASSVTRRGIQHYTATTMMMTSLVPAKEASKSSRRTSRA